MIRIKTLSLPLISAVMATAVAPATAQVALELSSQKTYRQDKKGVHFLGGRFDVNLSDGDGIYIGGCARRYYWVPNIPLDPCPGGATAFLIFGAFDGATATRGPYFWVESIIPAIVVEPRRPDLAFLRAAPASGLPRPFGGFKDTSFALYYNLHTTGVREYVVTRYSTTRNYTSNQRDKFEDEIVPGVYYYSFPRLRNPKLVAPITAVISPMPEGLAKLNNQKTGFEFTSINKNKWSKDGFMEIDYNAPNILQWRQLSPSVTYASVDDLYLSIRVMRNPKDPDSDTDLTDNTIGTPQSIFPGFASGGDPRVLLANPYVNSFALPPIFDSGTRGVLEIELQRAFRPAGVSYDFSSRKFQIPIIVTNKYADYAGITFDDKNKKAPKILADSDGDGYNNLNEWILESNANDGADIPIEPDPAYNGGEFDAESFQIIRNTHFGFTIDKKLGTTPAVKYTLQRSKDGGRTWQKFVSDADWEVSTVRLAAGANPRRENTPAKVEIRVEAKPFTVTDAEGNETDHFFEQPPGTENDRYRVKVTLNKKKKK